MFRSDLACLGFTQVTQCLPSYWVRKQLHQNACCQRGRSSWRMTHAGAWGRLGSHILQLPRPFPPRPAEGRFSWHFLATDLAGARCPDRGLERAELCGHSLGPDTSLKFKMKSHLVLCFSTKYLQGAESTKAVSNSLRYPCCLLT